MKIQSGESGIAGEVIIFWVLRRRRPTSLTLSKWMAFSTEGRGMMGFLVVMASEAVLACSDLPRMRGVTAHTGDFGMFTLVVQPPEVAVARPAVDHRLVEIRFFKVACLAGHRHHRSGGVNLMTRDTVERWPKTCPVTEVAEDRGMSALQRPRMPGSRAGGRKGPERHKRPPLGDRMANRTGSGENLTGLVHVMAVVASETPWPVTMTYVMGIGCPVDFHSEENAAVENGRNGIDGLIDLSFSIFKNLWVMFGVVLFNRSP